jgi:hypothetical protein
MDTFILFDDICLCSVALLRLTTVIYLSLGKVQTGRKFIVDGHFRVPQMTQLVPTRTLH